MLRFLDKEICCVNKTDMDWQQMMDYLVDRADDEKLYIIDEDGKFAGYTNYNMLFEVIPENVLRKEKMILNNGKNIWIVNDFLILDESVWENGRKYFAINPYMLIPVLNKEHQLICFAWNDTGADRELRMLEELMASDDAVGFREVHSKAGCVIVYGCNELAYFFVKYLEKMEVPLNVVGELWETFGFWKKADALDYTNLAVYAEGYNGDLYEEQASLHQSVSAEFECIDKIYEENIIRGNIKDADGTFQDLIGKIKGRNIVITGISADAFNAYDMLLGYGVDIYGFISENPAERGKCFFGKRVLSRIEIIKEVKEPVFIEVQSKYSAWGTVKADVARDLDFYNYIGYKRNESFFLLRDYTDISKNALSNIVPFAIEQYKCKLVLIGDFWLCLKFKRIFEFDFETVYESIVYCDVLEEHAEIKKGMRWIKADEVCTNDICLLLVPEYLGCEGDEQTGYSCRTIEKKKYIEKAAKKRIFNVLDYAADNFISNLNSEKLVGNISSGLSVKKIILGSIEHYSGNTFFREILDNHPEILQIQYSYLNENLFFICIRLAMEKKENILPLFWEIYEKESCKYYSDGEVWSDKQISRFNQSLKKLISVKETYTSQELFVILHIAYAEMWEEDVGQVSDKVIYWEPHFVNREKLEEYAIWLGERGMTGYIIEVVRKPCIRRGSMLRGLEDAGLLSLSFPHVIKSVFSSVLQVLNNEKKDYEGWQRLIIKFEDLKRNPQKELEKLCEQIGIQWSDTMLETTLHGKRDFCGNVTGFDLTPVYRLYEEYFSPFDIFRISLIAGIKQKQLGYSYNSIFGFSRTQLREMFNKEFLFEDKLKYEDDKDKIKIEMWKRGFISDCLWEVRRQDIMERMRLSANNGGVK